jgi:hypothetical protein
MAYVTHGATVHRMGRRPASLLLVSVLVVIQLLVGAFAQPAPLAMGDAGCVGDWPAHPAADTRMQSGDHSQLPAGGHRESNGAGQHHAGTHVVCRCGCAHTPAMGVSRLVMPNSSPPVDAVSAIAVPTFDPPLFEFLRPPN